MTEYDAGLRGLIFRSHGQRLLGTFYQGAGAGPRPTVVLLHGLPGIEKNLDLAYALRDMGWNAFVFHYRGCWGSGGTYSLTGVVDDVTAAIEAMLGEPGVDAGRLALAGLSLGGWAAVAAGAPDPRIRAIVSMCPLVDPFAFPLPPAEASEMARFLNGITAEEILEQWMCLRPLTEFGPALRGRPVLLLGAEKDELFPPAHLRLLAEAAPEIEWRTIAGADHVFSAHRREVVEGVTNWLRRNV